MGGKQFFCKLDSGIVMGNACNICPSVRTHSGLGEHNDFDFLLGRHQPNALTQPRTPVGHLDPCRLACCSHAGSDFEQSHGSAGVKQPCLPRLVSTTLFAELALLRIRPPLWSSVRLPSFSIISTRTGNTVISIACASHGGLIGQFCYRFTTAG